MTAASITDLQGITVLARGRHTRRQYFKALFEIERTLSPEWSPKLHLSQNLKTPVGVEKRGLQEPLLVLAFSSLGYDMI